MYLFKQYYIVRLELEPIDFGVLLLEVSSAPT
jgi:hypothetical protein